MRLNEYQSEAAATDQAAGDDERSVLVPLLGLAGEVGTLLSGYKKRLRDGEAHQRFRDEVAEDLGDLLWYVANTARKFGFDLEEVAARNLVKVKDRWVKRSGGGLFAEADLFDATFPATEQFPRRAPIEVFEEEHHGRVVSRMRYDGQEMGDPLTDNAHDDDGYRFHDVFHLAYAAILGWSPVIRKLMGRKRKSDPKVDEVEDGARARIAEELVSHLVFAYAGRHNFLDGVNSVDYHLLETIKEVVAGFEVSARSRAEWERAILQGFRVWNEVRRNGRGVVEIDLLQRSIIYAAPAAG